MAQDYADKIRKLLTTADHPGTDPTLAETYRAKALELAAQWEIDVAQLLVTEPERELEYGKTTVVLEGVPKIYWRSATSAMAHTVIALGGVGFSYERTPRVGIVCSTDDTDRIKSVVLLIATQMITEFNGWSRKPETRAKLTGMTAMQKFTYRNSFFMGFGARIVERLVAARAEAVSTTPGAELAIITKSDGAEAWAAEHCDIRMKKGPKFFASGAAAGLAAGSRADIGGVKIDGSGASTTLPLGS